MPEMTIRLRYDPATGKKDIVITLREDEDMLPHEHEQQHRALVEKLLEGGLVTASLLDLVFLPALFLTLGVRWVQEPDLVIEAAPGRVFDGMQAIPRMAGD